MLGYNTGMKLSWLAAWLLSSHTETQQHVDREIDAEAP
jgi:hypothetical protein